MKRFKWAAIVVLTGCLLLPTRSWAQGCTTTTPGLSCNDALVGGFITTAVLSIGLPVTTVGLLIFFIVSSVNSHPSAQPDAKAAELYLRQNQVELAQDLAAGSGPMLDNLGAALELKAEHQPRFARLLQDHRKQLTALIDPAHLTPATALDFFKSIAHLAETDAVLAPDYQAFRAHHLAQG